MSHAYPAPAKLNLFLHVVGRRADGYHLLQSVFRLIDRADTVHLELRGDGRVVREDDLPGVPEERDLSVRAARLLQAHAPAGAGVSIRLDKVLPMGGGLGGGSSDAATVLLALNRLWQVNLPRVKPCKSWRCNWAPTYRSSCSARPRLPRGGAKSCSR